MARSLDIGFSGELRRDARIVGLLFASTTSIIGSGWLFGAFHAANIAGPLKHLELDRRRRDHHAHRALFRGARRRSSRAAARSSI